MKKRRKRKRTHSVSGWRESPPRSPPSAAGESEHDRWAHLDFFVSFSRHLHLPHMVLSFQLTKHLNETCVSSYAFEDCRHTQRSEVLEHWGLCSFVKYCMNPVHLCFRRKEVTGERRGAAMETRQIWTQVCSRFIIYRKSGQGQGISIFLSCLDELWSRFVYPCFQFSAQPEICFLFCLFSDILYFHSCGIVGIMAMIKFAHILAVL